MPVKNLRATPTASPLARSAKVAFVAAPRNAETANSRLLFTMSGRLRVALSSVPATNPICTDIVSHAELADERPQSFSRVGTTAEALNHSVIPNSSATARNPSARHWVQVPSTSSPGTRSN